jgi:hypothetical protein
VWFTPSTAVGLDQGFFILRRQDPTPDFVHGFIVAEELQWIFFLDVHAYIIDYLLLLV